MQLVLHSPFLCSEKSNCRKSIIVPILAFLCVLKSLGKYDKSCMHEYTRYCPLKTRRKRHFFCTRRKKFLYAYKIIFRREAKYFFSREKFHFLVIHDFSCPEIYDKLSRKTRMKNIQKEQMYN